jgi:hypothetical protein
MNGLHNFDTSRRRFLRAGATLAGSAFAGAVLGAPALAWKLGEAERTVSPLAWRQLARQLSGSLIFPGQPGYAALAQPNNLRYQAIRPAAIALCQNAADVAACLQWCATHGVSLATRGGGHSYAGFSCTEGLMISIKDIKDIAYDEATERVTVGGGARNAAVYAALKETGRSITHGRCPSVGVAGFLLGGGVGFDMRNHGIGSDRLVETQLVLANGAVATANAVENPDLFWACRGGAGGNFGINISFTLETFPVDRIVVFSIEWSAVSDPFLETLFHTLETAPRQLGSRISLNPAASGSGQPGGIDVALLGQFLGSENDLREILAPVYRLASPDSELIEDMAYWNGQAVLAEPGKPAYYQERSRFINGPMPAAFIPVVRRWLSRWINVQGSGSIKFFQTGGTVNDMPADATAFVHRQSEWLASIEINWNPDQSMASRHRAHHWQNDFYEEIVPLAGGGAFQNFVDPSLRDWASAYYGANLPRLRQVKTEVDPGNLFRFPQSIRPAQ